MCRIELNPRKYNPWPRECYETEMTKVDAKEKIHSQMAAGIGF